MEIEKEIEITLKHSRHLKVIKLVEWSGLDRDNITGTDLEGNYYIIPKCNILFACELKDPEIE